MDDAGSTPRHDATAPATGDRFRLTRSAAVGVALVAIWAAVVLTSIFTPDFVSGSEQEHLPIAAFQNWLLGLLATGYVAAAGRGRDGDRAPRQVWAAFAVGIGAIWLAVTLAAVFAPDFVTGDDPTRIPIAGLFGPIAGVLGTAYVAIFAAGDESRSH